MKRNLQDQLSKFILIFLAAIALGLVFYKLYFLKFNMPSNMAISMSNALENFSSSNIVTNVIIAPVISKVVVDISGQVKRPGVYRLNKGSRIVDLLRESGGVLEDADMTQLNLAAVLTDSQKIFIPPLINQKIEKLFAEKINNHSTDGKLINLNTATSAELEKLPGIGKKYAEGIIALRNKNGGFSSYEQLKQVKGIGAKRLEKIKAVSSL